MNEPCVTGHYDVIDTSIENCYYVYSYLRRNQKKLSFEKSYKNITGSAHKVLQVLLTRFKTQKTLILSSLSL